MRVSHNALLIAILFVIPAIVLAEVGGEMATLDPAAAQRWVGVYNDNTHEGNQLYICVDGDRIYGT